MINQFTALCLFALALAMLQMPAQADLNVSFGAHDRNHDGRWNYREFHNANRDYYHHHPGVQVLYGNRADFNRLDCNHDGYVDMQEARAYHNWD